MSAARAQQIAEEAAQHFASGKPGLFIPRAVAAPPAFGAEIQSNDGIVYGSLEEAFPDVDAGIAPTGNLLLVMMRQVPLRTAGGIHLNRETRSAEADNNQVAKVIAIGPLAFHNRDTYAVWPEGAWCKAGDFIRVPKYQGDMWTVPYVRVDREVRDDGKAVDVPVTDYVRFALFKDIAITGLITASPLTIRAYL